MRADEVMREILLPRFAVSNAGLQRRVDFLKVSKRRELDISIVAAAFCIDTDSAGVVRKARLAYGGVAAMPGRARRAEAALEGRKWSEVAGTIDGILRDEFKPIDDARGGAEYRRNLVVSLWQKFVSGEQSQAQDANLDFTADGRWAIEDHSRALNHESAVGHVTGRALYVDDTAQRRPMLHDLHFSALTLDLPGERGDEAPR
jgi:xanthine dehydrogenase iron-sulfur cluster and FAD-binding subunit A